MLATDRDRFRDLMETLARTLPPARGPMTDQVVEDYWDALKDLPIEVVENRIRFVRQHGKSFPRPSDIRPPLEKRGDAHDTRNYIRDHWRSLIFAYGSDAFGYRFSGGTVRFEQLLRDNQDALAKPFRVLLDDLEQQTRRDGPTHGQDLFCQRRCIELARANQHLRAINAPKLPPAPADAEPELAF